MSPFEVCELLGIPFDPEGINILEGKKYDTPWGGKKMNGLDCVGRKQKYQDLFHEIGHWLVASEERRSYPTFGLGRSYDLHPGELLLPTHGDSTDEEIRASATGILLHAAVADPRGSWAHAEFHSWFSQCGKDAWTELQKECPKKAREMLATVGIILPVEKPKNWRSR